MRCEETRAALLEARYARSEVAPEVAAHVAGCAACQNFASAQQKLDAALDAREPVQQPGPGFDTRFFARLNEQRGRERLRRARWLWWLAPVMASAAALALFAWHRPHGDALAAEDVAIARDLELVEALPTLEHLDEAEAYETLSHVSNDELERMGNASP